jgi:SAM-dependent methyltransferase
LLVAQNIYDDEEFFAGYSRLPRSVSGHDGAPEWLALRGMLPSVEGKRIIDLGCGFGWFSRWAADNGAGSVVGIDLSSRMLARARTETVQSTVAYRQQDLDRLLLDGDAFDIAYSSLTLHYLENIEEVLGTVHDALSPGGVLVFSVEHPIFTAPSRPAFVTSPDGSVAWPVDNYLIEGRRVTSWFAPEVVKQHRTIGTYVKLLLGVGFLLDDLIEWGPTSEQVEAVPGWSSEVHRPAFLLVRVHRS